MFFRICYFKLVFTAPALVIHNVFDVSLFNTLTCWWVEAGVLISETSKTF